MHGKSHKKEWVKGEWSGEESKTTYPSRMDRDERKEITRKNRENKV